MQGYVPWKTQGLSALGSWPVNTGERMGYWISGAFFSAQARRGVNAGTLVHEQHSAAAVATWCDHLKPDAVLVVRRPKPE